jgi:hypothetical protein
MMSHSKGHKDPIAIRHLRICRKDKTPEPIQIELYAPAEAANKAEYHCFYRITGLKKKIIEEESVGVDGIQAIHLCVQMIANWISIVSSDSGVEIQWNEGSVFDNLELCRQARPLRQGSTRVIQSGAVLEREIHRAFSIMRNDPDSAERVFKRIRRRARRSGLIHQAMQCLYGQLAITRIKDDEKAELRLARIIAEHQPTAENIIVVANELEKRGRLQEVPKLYERALALLDEGTKLHEFVAGKLGKIRGERHRRGRAG